MDGEMIHQARGPGLPAGPSELTATPGDIFWAEEVGVEIASHAQDGKDILVRDSKGNVGIIFQAAGNVLIDGEWLPSEARIMLNAYLCGQIIAMLREFCIIVGEKDAMHEALDKMRAEMKVRLAGLDTKDFV